MINNSFQNNFAGNEGGCIKYTRIYPTFENNIFQNNLAYYGNNVAGFISYALILNIISFDYWENIYSRDVTNVYIENFCTFPKNVTVCPRNNFSYLDLVSKIGNISNFNITLPVNDSQIFPGKIMVLLLEVNGQIVTTQNAIGQLDRSQIMNLNYNDTENAYILSPSLSKTSNILSRLQTFTAEMGIITIGNFEVDYVPGKSFIF